MHPQFFPLPFSSPFSPRERNTPRCVAIRRDTHHCVPTLNIYIYIYIYLISSREKGAHLSNSAFRPGENFNFPSARTAFIFNRRASEVAISFEERREIERERNYSSSKFRGEIREVRRDEKYTGRKREREKGDRVRHRIGPGEYEYVGDFPSLPPEQRLLDKRVFNWR